MKPIVRSGKDSPAFQAYLRTRERVVAMLEEARDPAVHADPSAYWSEELGALEYLLDASPLIIDRLREHCHHLTGLRSYDYRRHHAHKAGPFLNKLRALQAADSSDLFVPESPVLGGFGHLLDGQLVNLDTLKFYESLIALDRAGCLAPLRQANQRPVVVEIGSGWGGAAYQLKQLIPDLCYVVIDLPTCLLFSGTYLQAAFPEARVRIYGDQPAAELTQGLEDCDFLLLPHFFIAEHALPRIDLGINMVSFQEMTSEQVRGYVHWFADCGAPALYSHNRDRSPHNRELGTVSSILAERYAVEPVQVLGVPYIDLSPRPDPEPPPPLGLRDTLRTAWHLLSGREPEPPAPAITPDVHSYRHLIGRLG